jgi:CRISPR/Cas system Type II protein with McrA/HNH and RuvC-like nuclease domain
MSKEEDKLKHSKRIHSKETAIKKQTNIAKAHGLDVKEPHKFAKHHALDCGIPGCSLCSNPRKLYKEETIQEKRAKQMKVELE